MSDQACVPTDVCVRWGCNRAPLVWSGRFYVCENCGHSYGKNPHPDLPEPDPTGGPQDTESAEVERLRRALSFAASVIKSGEGWTSQCDQIIGAALNTETDDAP